MDPNTKHQTLNTRISRCIELARLGAGSVSPNPMVGSVIVDADGRVVGEGYHQRYGEAHAEVNAVADAKRNGANLHDATIYVSLEPCSHHGKTPPCADLIIREGIPRAVIGMRDPFPKVDGAGIERLRAAGVEVTVGVLEDECRRLNRAFIHHVQTGRPLVTLKIAQTLDGRTATATGESKWITSEDSRRRVHQWRAEQDAVLVGAGTAHADDPSLTVRLAEGRNPIRIVLDRAGTLPPTLKLFTDAHAGQTLVVTAEDVRPSYIGPALHLPAPVVNGHVDLTWILDRLGAGDTPLGRPVQSVLVEAGTGLATAMLPLADRIALFLAPKLLGSPARPAFGDLGIERMHEAIGMRIETVEQAGEDVLVVCERRNGDSPNEGINR
ncbi:MAG: bifunctional diaminohydroxyphosphoribosylaminopyrimidine deaminase/5-amino-6-(5-phosphoribosylamino)uracil reductase RibD [Bacteroidota bacterium]